MSTECLKILPICQIQMISTAYPTDKLKIRVERGSKPRLKCSEDKKHVQITVPLDTQRNWPPVRAELFGGYYVILQRLQQQFKITVQHTLERKPEFVVYSSCLSHEKDVKTQVKEINTQLAEVGIAGPNLDISGVLKAQRLTLESTVGTMHIYAKIEAERLRIHAQNLVVASEALISTNKLKMVARRIQIDGKIYPSEGGFVDDPKIMSVQIDAFLVHIGVDGRIGESNEKEKSKVAKKSHTVQIVADGLLLQVSGSVANYGKIVSNDKIDLSIGGSLLSLSDGSIDSAGRGYDALKQIRGIRNAVDCAPSSSTLHSAINDQNASAVTKLIESGVDKNDRARSKRMTLRQTAIMKYREMKETSQQNNMREKITLINALFTVHDWRRGSITAQVIQASIGKNCEDCAQFTAEQLQAKVEGSASVEADSIWHCQYVEMDINGSLTVSGQVKHKTAIFNVLKETIVHSDAIMSHEILARLSTLALNCDGIWSVGETLVIDVKENAEFGFNSYIESEKMEAAMGENCQIGGTWQIGSIWMLVDQSIITTNDGKIFIEENATVGANKFMCSGLWNVTGAFELQVKDSSHFFHSSKMESHSFRLLSEFHCTVGGLWIVENMHLYVRHDLITTSTGKVAILSEGTVTVGCFRSDSKWQAEKNLNLLTGSFEQSDDGTLFVKEKLDISIHSNSEYCSGKIVCSHLTMKSLKHFRFDGFIKVNDVDITLPYMDESRFTLAGQMDVLVGSLTLKGNSSLDTMNARKLHHFPAFILLGKLNAMAIIAPFLSVELGHDSMVRLFGVKSYFPEVDFNVLISAGALTMRPGSTVLSLGDNEISEGIICATVWSHQGQIRFQTNKIHLLCGSLLNKGRLTSMKDKQNHLGDVRILVEDFLINDGILSAHKLSINGDGSLENNNRIFAVDSMDIRLQNFSNDDGHIESKNSLKLLSVSKEWTKVGGSIRAKTNFDLCANKLNFAIKDITHISHEKRVSFSAKTDLLISTNILDETREMTVGCAAQRSVSIDAQMNLDRLEVLLGSTHILDDSTTSTLRISSDSIVHANTIVINGTSPIVVLVIDGQVTCSRVRVAKSINTVLIAGKGSLDCNSVHIDGEVLCFDLYQVLSATDIVCKEIQVKKDSVLRLKSPDAQTTTVSCDSIIVEGTVFVDDRVFISSFKNGSGSLSLKGNIIGTSQNSELSLESDSLRLAGQIANFKFLEVYCKRAVSSTDILKLKSINSMAIECAEINLNTDVDHLNNVVMNADCVTLNGTMNGIDNSSCSIFCGTLQNKMKISKVDKFEVKARGQIVMHGEYKQCANVSIDAKWLNSTVRMEDCGVVNMTAWGTVNGGFIGADEINVTNLGVFINNDCITTKKLRIVAPFVVSVAEKSDVFAELTQLYSMVTCCNHEMANTANVDTSNTYLWIHFSESSSPLTISEDSAQSWKDTATMLKDRFKSNSTDVDETVLAMKYISDLTHTRVQLHDHSEFFQDLTKITSRFSAQPISLFNNSRFVSLVFRARSNFRVQKTVETDNKRKSGGGKRKWSGTALYEGLVQFKNSKYNRDSRCSSDTVDIGYVSRSSSEELDNKEDVERRSKPNLLNDELLSLFAKNHFDVIEEKLDESIYDPELTAEQLNASFHSSDPELDEFEELEQEIEDEEEGQIRTDFIICREERIGLAPLRQKATVALPPRPRNNFPMIRTPSSNDLVMKKLKVKRTISTMDLRSFGSESSLCSLDVTSFGEMGSPMQFPKSPFQRSMIPRGSFRRPRDVGYSPVKA